MKNTIMLIHTKYAILESITNILFKPDKLQYVDNEGNTQYVPIGDVCFIDVHIEEE